MEKRRTRIQIETYTPVRAEFLRLYGEWKGQQMGRATESDFLVALMNKYVETSPPPSKGVKAYT